MTFQVRKYTWSKLLLMNVSIFILNNNNIINNNDNNDNNNK